MISQTLTAYNCETGKTSIAVTMRLSYKEASKTATVTGCILQVSQCRYKVCIRSANRKQLVSFTYDSLKEARKEALALLLIAAKAATKNTG